MNRNAWAVLLASAPSVLGTALMLWAIGPWAALPVGLFAACLWFVSHMDDPGLILAGHQWIAVTAAVVLCWLGLFSFTILLTGG